MNMKTNRLDVVITNEASSFVKGFSYDRTKNKGTLQVQLESGTYRYYGVPAATFADLITSSSDGKAYNKLIKGNFRSRKMKTVTPTQAGL
jgi:hypothetical protein